MKDIFQASREGDLETVKALIAQGANLQATTEYGSTALHCAAIGSNTTDPETNLQILKLLVEAGSDLEARSPDGRTPLYFLAEFSPSIESVQYLIDCGANPDVRGHSDVHVVVNAMMPEVQALLSELSGFPIPKKPEPLPEVKLSKEQWKKAKSDVSAVFRELRKQQLVALQGAGYTQSDGFSDCVEAYHRQPNKESILGFCFYTRQDLNRARRSGILPLAFWGAPEGEEESMKKVGRIILDTLEAAGMEVEWSGDAGSRPMVLLRNYAK